MNTQRNMNPLSLKEHKKSCNGLKETKNDYKSCRFVETQNILDVSQKGIRWIRKTLFFLVIIHP